MKVIVPEANAGAYGRKACVKLEHADGRKAVWFTSTGAGSRMRDGRNYQIRATVKAHRVNARYGNETVLKGARGRGIEDK